MPLISFIIAYYNTPAGMLDECIGSILDLSLSEDEREIIVVDDGSDVPLQPTLNFPEGQIKYIHRENGGPGAARNSGMDIAKGKFIQFVDADDKLIADAYNKCVELARTNAADVITFGFTYSLPTKNNCGRCSDAGSGVNYMKKNNLLGAACPYLFSSELTSNVRFPEKMFHEDEYFIPIMMLKARSVIKYSGYSYFYRKHDKSITHSKDKDRIKRRMNDMKEIIIKLDSHRSTLDNATKGALDRKIDQLTMDLIYNVIRQVHSLTFLSELIKELRGKNLYPLKNRRYTKKYSIFCPLANSKSGLLLLYFLLPLTKEENI